MFTTPFTLRKLLVDQVPHVGEYFESFKYQTLDTILQIVFVVIVCRHLFLLLLVLTQKKKE